MLQNITKLFNLENKFASQTNALSKSKILLIASFDIQDCHLVTKLLHFCKNRNLKRIYCKYFITYFITHT